MRAGPLLAASALSLGLFAAAPAAQAHEVRPAYFELAAAEAGRFEALWKQPILPGSVGPGLAYGLRLEPRLEPPCAAVGPARDEARVGALVRRWTLDCGEAGLAERAVVIDGLERSLTDVLLRVRFADGDELVQLIKPAAARFVIDRESAPGVWAYLRIGVEHLLFGADHILFVIGLLFFVRRPLELVQVITAFTVAHSVTLAISSLGWMRLPQAPVEALIALTILYLAVEILDRRRTAADRSDGPVLTPDAGETRSETIGGVRPWVLAFAFGLLHGFGFAGALAEIGLPEQAIAGALFLFNVGVELGQLLVVAAILGLLALLRAAGARVPTAVALAPVWVMGSVAAFWFLERTAGLL